MYKVYIKLFKGVFELCIEGDGGSPFSIILLRGYFTASK